MFLAFAVVAGISAFAFYRGVPSVLEPTLWSNPPPLLKFEGPTATNSVLANARKVEGNPHGPESTAFDPEDGTAYVSFSDGTVGSFTMHGQRIATVFFSGGYIANKRNEPHSNGLHGGSKELQNWCSIESNEGRLAWDVEGEKRCGRPLGLRFRQEADGKYLYIIDAYHGVFKLNVQTNEVTHLVHIFTPIKSHPGMDPKALLTPTFYNDLDVSISGKIVFSDSSYRYSRSQNRPEILDGAPRGRLFEYDPVTEELSVVLCGLHFPNGVQYLAPHVKTYTEKFIVSDKVPGQDAFGADMQAERIEERQFEENVQEDVIVNELTRFRVLKVNTATALQNTAELTASCAEDGGLYKALDHSAAPSKHDHYASTGVDYFIDNVPGLADNVRADSKLSADGRQYYLYGLGSKSTQPFSLLWMVLQSNALRDVIGRVLPMKLVEKLVPRYGLVLVSDDQGNVVNALHDPSGSVSMLSQAERHPITGDLWLGSHSEDLAILPAEFLPEKWQ